MWRHDHNRILPLDQVARRAGGRRHYNAVRRLRAVQRKVQVAQLYREGLSQHEIARRLGVHPSTISRDLAYLHTRWLAYRHVASVRR
jgi:IS30 family transposase